LLFVRALAGPAFAKPASNVAATNATATITFGERRCARTSRPEWAVLMFSPCSRVSRDVLVLVVVFRAGDTSGVAARRRPGPQPRL